MDLFNQIPLENLPGTPLAEVLRPKNLDQIIGQSKSIGPQSPVGQLIRNGKTPSLIVWGPPGTGKTSFAQILSQQIDAEYIQVNAVETGAKQLREIGDSAKYRRLSESRKTLLFVDEIHRFNKSQQDVLLPFVERGDLILVGATTENPAYELNRALMSRCRLVVFERLNESDLLHLLNRASDFYKLNVDLVFNSDSVNSFLKWVDGDARRLLNACEIIFNTNKNEWPHTPESLTQLLGELSIGYDKNSDQHYDVISAFIKSVRGSDADAALYYLARMLKGGEDPVFIARRLVILASEDIGNADPRALSLAIAGAQAVELIGLPEAAINLSQVVTYLASAPKSNRSYMALNKARELVEKTGTLSIPLHLRSSKSSLMSGIGYGVGYEYPQNAPKGWTEQKYLPPEIQSIIEKEPLYQPSERGFEKTIREYLKWMKGN